jgi:energy-coupling factor transporter transmembrane protein EcfT
LGAVYVTQEGISQGAGQSFRLIIVLWGAVLLARTTTLEELANAVEGRGTAALRPLVGVVTVALAYLPILVESGRRIRARNRWRSGHPGFLAGIRLVANSALPLVVASIRDADRLAEAMEARSYDPLSARTPFGNTPSSRTDLPFAAAAVLAALVAVAGYV